VVKAIDQGLDELAQTLHLVFEPIEPRHWSSVKGIHCTGVYTVHCTGVGELHWSLHWWRWVLLPGLGALAGIGAAARPGGDLALGHECG
jgi:hypothetical protein